MPNSQQLMKIPPRSLPKQGEQCSNEYQNVSEIEPTSDARYCCEERSDARLRAALALQEQRYWSESVLWSCSRAACLWLTRSASSSVAPWPLSSWVSAAHRIKLPCRVRSASLSGNAELKGKHYNWAVWALIWMGGKGPEFKKNAHDWLAVDDGDRLISLCLVAILMLTCQYAQWFQK